MSYEEYLGHTLKAYAGYICNDEILSCASGGIATALTDAWISNGGYVAGVRYKKDFRGAEYVVIHHLDEINQLKGSKYIDADLNGIFQEVKRLLLEGEKVLFFGLPCRVGGLKAFLKEDNDNLLTCELVCHGPTYKKVHTDFIDYLEKKYQSKVVYFSVREKKNTWTPYYIHATFENGKEYWEEFGKSVYGQFFYAISLERCYNCYFKGNKRVGDIQIGDFWGYDKKADYFNVKGTSCILAHTEKGVHYLETNKYLTLFETNPAPILKGNPYIIQKRQKGKKYQKAVNVLEEKDLFKAVKKTRTIRQKIRKLIPNSIVKLANRLIRNFHA